MLINSFVFPLFQLSDQMRNGISSRASCWACNALAGLFLSPVYSKDMMTMAVNTVCTSFRLQSPRVCSGIVESFKVSHTFYFMLKIRASLCCCVANNLCFVWCVPLENSERRAMMNWSNNRSIYIRPRFHCLMFQMMLLSIVLFLSILS